MEESVTEERADSPSKVERSEVVDEFDLEILEEFDRPVDIGDKGGRREAVLEDDFKDLGEFIIPQLSKWLQY